MENYRLLQIQHSIESEIPLVLIHDGSGTCASYYRMNSLRRPVFGLCNPRFSTGRPWKGGILELARVHVDLIRSKFAHGEIILGGYSLGGFLCLEIARILQEETDITIHGVIMVDSFFPHAELHQFESNNDINHLLPSCNNANEIQIAVKRCLKRSAEMLRKWDLSACMASYDVPETILVKAESPVPVPNLLVDVHRQDPWLGWNTNEDGFVQHVVNVPGHHYNLFDENHAATISTVIGGACDYISSLK